MLLIYRYLINILFPIIIIIIFLRTWFNKEDKNRFKEKLFTSSFNVVKDNKKKLIWFHAASIGELKSIIPLVKKLNEKNIFEFLVTTVTLSSAHLIEKEFLNEKNITHRFFPVDKILIAERFLDKWSPDMIIFVDSEIWPNFLLTIKKRAIPLVLLNGRITKKTFLRWNLIPNVAQNIFQTFDLCLSSSKESKEYLEKLKAKNVKCFGNLKLTSENTLANSNFKNKEILKNTKFWCAVSTHKGEDVFCLKTHFQVKKKHKNITTVIIPRHIERVKSIELSCRKLGLKSQIVSEDNAILPNSEIIIINTYGVLTNYLQFSRSVFIGKSMIKKLESVGGQNPIEAAKLGCKVYHGPYVYNFKDIYELLNKYKISEKINDEIELANKIIIDFDKAHKINDDKIRIINNLGKDILKNTYNELYKIYNK
jgi:3-deoxy-D-manno-octulosonic-acid transferase